MTYDTRLLRWKKLKEGWFALNIDSNVTSKEGRTRCSGVIRDEKDYWIAGFSMNLGTFSIEEAEA